MRKLKNLLRENFNKLHILLEQCESKESLELVSAEFDKLNQLLSRKTNDVNNYVSSVECYEMLNQCLDKVFPRNGFIEKNVEDIISACSKGNQQKITAAAVLEYKAKAKTHITGNMPLNVCDDEWMAKFLQQVCYLNQKNTNEMKLEGGKMPTALREISLADVENFIRVSKTFKQKRNFYKRQVVKYFSSKIAEIYTQKGETNLFAFRDQFVDLACLCGFNKQEVNYGLESNSQWRKIIIDNQYVKCGRPVTAFKTNTYYDDISDVLHNNPVAYARLTLMDDLLKKNYAEKQELNYYLHGGQKDTMNRIGSHYGKMAEEDLIKQSALLESKYKYLCYAYSEEAFSCVNLVKNKPAGIEK